MRVFADLKLFDISETLTIDGVLLKDAKPELLTVVCGVGSDPMRQLKAALPGTEILGVTVLTSMKECDVQAMYSCSMSVAVLRNARE